MKHFLKLYGTLGPACCDKDCLKEMLLAGMTGIRLNLSHKTLAECRDWLVAYHEAAEDLHMLPELLVDLQGPELRIGNLKQVLNLEAGGEVILVPDPAAAKSEKDSDENKEAGSMNTISKGASGSLSDPDSPSLPVIPCPPILFDHFKEGLRLKLNDGKILLEIIRLLNPAKKARARVIIPGELSSRKSIAADHVTLPLPVLTDQDRETLTQLRSYRVTGVMLPFVRSRQDLITLRKELMEAGMDYIRVFAKLETQEGLDVLPDLLPYCDEIIIARGDLGNAIPLPRLPGIQKKVAATCLRAHRPFMVVTQMLASMEHSPVPTRAEVTDIFQAVLDGASSLMLTGETAIGDYPVEAIRVLHETAEEARRFQKEGPLPLF